MCVCVCVCVCVWGGGGGGAWVGPSGARQWFGAEGIEPAGSHLGAHH